MSCYASKSLAGIQNIFKKLEVEEVSTHHKGSTASLKDKLHADQHDDADDTEVEEKLCFSFY